jgi:hypothetical protein
MSDSSIASFSTEDGGNLQMGCDCNLIIQS